jgi:Tfp pilus assembly protein PilW
MLKIYKRLKNDDGISVIELLIALVAMFFVTGLIFILYQTILRVNDFSYTASKLQQDARMAIALMTRDIRETTSISTATSSSLSIYTDPDDNDLQDKVTYTVSNGTLTRTVEFFGGATTSKLLTNDVIESSIFLYYKGDGSVCSDPITEAKTVQVTFTLDNDIGKPPNGYIANVTVLLRSINLE